ncbi:Cation/H(+) antiporter 25-like protein, partial [Drosera capensis]
MALSPYNSSLEASWIYNAEFAEPVCKRARAYPPFEVFRGTISPLDFSFTYILLEASLVLLLAHALRFLLKPLHQPKVIPDIIAGILIGPSGLGRHKSFAANIFPRNCQFMVRNIGLIGFMYFLFISGVKMDLIVIKKAGKKQWSIALAGVIFPHIVLLSFAFGIRKYMDKDLAKPASIGGIASAMIITTFPVIYTALQDLNLLSSEIGRLALSTAIINDVIGLVIVVAFEAAKQGETKSINALYYVICLFAVSSAVLGGVPKVMAWIKRRTPEGKPVSQSYVTMILLGVFLCGYATDFIGAAIGNGPLWLGLAIPDGPPLGATLAEKVETITMHILSPFSYITIGMLTDFYSMSTCWSCVGPLLGMALVGYSSKLVSVLLTCMYLDMTFREGLTLSLMLSLRGQVEFLLYVHWMDWKMVRTPNFSMMVLLTILSTGIVSPLINYLYDPTRPYMTNKRRTIQHHYPNTDLRIVASIYDEESVKSLFSLLEVSNPTSVCSFSVSALCLIEIVGRASPIFIDHSQQQEYWDNTNEAIHSALKFYEGTRDEHIKVEFFTVVTAQRTMYQDICELALLKKASLIILPFHKKCLNSFGAPEVVRPGVQSVNFDCLLHAPCSVGILVSKSALLDNLSESFSHGSTKQFVMLFLGGADSREALAYADRTIGNPDIHLTVVRFLAQNYRGDDERERKLDDGVVTSFWVKNETNERVAYREVVVSSGAETIAAVQDMGVGSYDLWIVGKENAMNPVLLEGLSDWMENPELGVIGDYLSSMDFGRTASVLVLQQQILRDDRPKKN